MTDYVIKKAAAGFGLLAFSFLLIGSWISGVRLWVALVRGVEGFLVFGALAWLLGKLVQTRIPPASPEAVGEDDEDAKGAHLDETA
ncbi:MAG: hypothetical protein ACE5ER_00785 [Nitrospinaceae bacterium]